MTQDLHSQDQTPQESLQVQDPAAIESPDDQPSGSDALAHLLESASAKSDQSQTPGSGVLAGKSGLLIGIGIGLVLGVGVVGSRMLLDGSSSAAGSAPESAAEAVATETSLTSQSVTLASVEQTQVSRTLQATGTVAAYDLLPILPRTSGLQIQRVLVDEGDSVRAGQVMAVLDRTVLESQLNEAEAQLQSALARVQQQEAVLEQARARQVEAETQRRRYESLLDDGVISREEYDSRVTSADTAREEIRVAAANVNSAESEVRSQNARIQQLQAQLEQTLVKAPADGLVAERMARVGDVSSTTQKLFSIIRDRQLELQVRLPETQLPQVQIGSPVYISSDADARLQLQGRVREISPLIDEQTREATVSIDLPASEWLRPGMFLQAQLVTSVVEGLVIPAAAVLPESDGSATVFRVAAGDRAEAVQVELGELIDDETGAASRIEILRGLSLGDRVVVRGAGYLSDGDPIEVAAQTDS